MRDVPVGVDRIAVETAAEMVVHSAGCHFAEGEQVHLQSMLAALGLRTARVNPREKIQGDRARKFRGDAEPAFMRVIAAGNLLVSGVEGFSAQFLSGIGD